MCLPALVFIDNIEYDDPAESESERVTSGSVRTRDNGLSQCHPATCLGSATLFIALVLLVAIY